ncbi:hypothetical protein KY334_03765 [Candidatus Woesearchaeota archaeon]|nr:hypothetical protein [Candidatus Woesearchaeota archaeon]
MFSKKGMEIALAVVVSMFMVLLVILLSVPMIREPIANFVNLGRSASKFVDNYCDEVPRQLAKDKDLENYGSILLPEKDKRTCRNVLQVCFYDNYDPKNVEFLEIYQTKEWQDAKSFCCVWKYKDINPYFKKADQDLSSCVASIS